MTKLNVRYAVALAIPLVVATAFNACSGGFQSVTNSSQGNQGAAGTVVPDPTPFPNPQPAPSPVPNPQPNPAPQPQPGPSPQPQPQPQPNPAPAPQPTPSPTLPSSARVKFTVQPGGAGAAVGWPVQPVVTIYDQSGNQLNTNAQVRVQINNNTTGAVLYGNNVNQQAKNGVATFSNLSIDRPGVYQLIANVPGIGSAVSNQFAVSAAGGQVYYVSPSGNDSNNGTSQSTAWKTVTKVNQMTFNAGDAVLFQGGQSFSGCLTIGTNVKSTAAQPFTIGAYGSGQFTLNANCSKTESSYSVLNNKAAVSIGIVTGFVLQDCILRGNASQFSGNSYGAAYGVLFNNGYYDSGKTTSSVTIQRCDISGFYTTNSTDFAGDVFFNLSGPTTHISILNNVIHGSSGATSADDNGIAGNARSMDGRLADSTIQGNHVYNIGGRANGPGGTLGSGIMMAGTRILVQNNAVHDTGANTNTCGGPSNIWIVEADQCTVQYNESYRSRPKDLSMASGGPNAGGCDWDGFDMDMGVTNSVTQYNYSHENFGGGLLAYVAETWGPNTFRYNISVADGSSFNLADWSGGAGTIHVYNNILDALGSSGWPFESGGTATNGFIANNLWRGGVNQYGASQMANTNGGNPSKMKLTNNAYWTSLSSLTSAFFNWSGSYNGLAAFQSGTKQDAAGLAFTSGSPPAMTIPSSIITCDVATITSATDEGGLVKCLGSNYQAAAGSSMDKGGVDLRGSAYNVDIGVRDFWGNALPAVGGVFGIGP